VREKTKEVKEVKEFQEVEDRNFQRGDA